RPRRGRTPRRRGGPACRRSRAPRRCRDRARRDPRRRRRARHPRVGRRRDRGPPPVRAGRVVLAGRRGRACRRRRRAAARGRADRGRPGAARRDPGATPAAPRPAPQVRRHARGRDRLPRRGPHAPPDLESFEARAAALDRERMAALERAAAQAAVVGGARRAAAPKLAAAVERELAELAMAKARVAVEVGDDDPGDDVTFLLAANPGAPLLPLSKVASGGELARAMLALRLVLLDGRDDSGPPTLVFDEVDAGIGGQAALAVGRALAALARERQVLVVTHLPQVAAHADTQVAVTKTTGRAGTTATATILDDETRVVELARMLSGSPRSATAREHAGELLAAARRAREPPR